jgi:hypothetical protein
MLSSYGFGNQDPENAQSVGNPNNQIGVQWYLKILDMSIL